MSDLFQGLKYETKWIITKFASDDDFAAGLPYETVNIDSNIMLNTGIDEVWDLVCGTGSPTAFDNTNAKLGVGDSSTAESAAQTGLQAVTNKLYKSMDATYPTTTSQQAVFRSTFTSLEANYAWNEFCCNNGATNESTGVRLNRKVSSQGTKTSGQTWQLTLTVTLS